MNRKMIYGLGIALVVGATSMMQAMERRAQLGLGLAAAAVAGGWYLWNSYTGSNSHSQNNNKVYPTLIAAVQSNDYQAVQHMLNAMNEQTLIVQMSHAIKEAIQNGNSTIVTLLVSHRINAWYPEFYSLNSALEYAAEYGQCEIIELLIGLGANVNAMSNYYSPLVLAVKGGHTEAVRLLIAHGASAQYDSALECAAQYAHDEIITILLDNGASVNANSGAPLALAAQHGNSATVILLLDRGANVHAGNDRALQWAAQHGQTEVITILLDRGADINVGNGLPLNWAIQYGHLAATQLLLDRGANIHAGNDFANVRGIENVDKNAALQWAIESDQVLQIHILILNWMDDIPDMPETNNQVIKDLVTVWRTIGTSAYKHLFHKASFDTVKSFIEFSKNPDVFIAHKGQEGRLLELYPGKTTLLMWSAVLGDQVSFDKILADARTTLCNNEYNLYVNRVDVSGNTALSYAFYGRNESIITLLLAPSLGARINPQVITAAQETGQCDKLLVPLAQARYEAIHDASV